MSEFDNPPKNDRESEPAENAAPERPDIAAAATSADVPPPSTEASDFAGFENGAAEAPPPPPQPAAAAVPVVAARRPLRSLFWARILQALWFGSGVFVAFAAVAVFRAMNPVDAADAVGAMLTRWHYIALLAPAILTIIEWRRVRSRMVTILFIAVLLAVMQGFTDLRIRQIRMNSATAISSLDRNDPVRRRFGALHGFSSVLLLAQIAAAAAAIAAEPEPDR